MAVSSQVTLWSLLSGKKKKIEKEKGVGLVRYFLSKPDVQIKVTLTPGNKLFLCTTMSSYLILPPLHGLWLQTLTISCFMGKLDPKPGTLLV